VKNNTEQFIGGVPDMPGQGSRRTFLARAGGAAGILAAVRHMSLQLNSGNGERMNSGR
jgi:hypothetical protein